MFGANSLNPADYAVAEIQGYASLTSVNQGGTIDFHVRTINTNPYTLSIFRIGWYNGAGSRLMLGPITLPGVVQPMPPAPVYPPAGTGIVECNWSVSYSLTVPTDWVSGVYFVKLSLSSPWKESYIVFVVRDDARNSPLLYQSSVATFQAYNEWGGSSLYTVTPGGQKTGVKVSFDRPYWVNYGAGNFIDFNEPGPEIQMVRWLERQGYDVTYATDIDTHENPNTVLSHKAFLVVGHDEYWSRNMRDNVTRGRDTGVNLGIFGANVLYWQVRFEPSSTGAADRTMVGYKELAAMDPIADPRLVTPRWRDLGEPEGALLGVQYNMFSSPTVSDIVVTNASHWLFNGTGVTNGTIFPNVEGYETDSLYAPSGATVLAHSPFPRDNPVVFGDMTIYTADSGALVFAAGSIFWPLGLDALWPSPGVVPAMQQVAANFLSRALQGTPPTLNSVNPNSGAQGQNLTSVILTGSGFQSGATCNFGGDITVNSCTFNSATQLTASISISATAALGSRNVIVTNPDNQSSTLTNGFTVTIIAPPPPPTLSSVNPSSGAQGQSLASVILTGSNFQSGATCNFGADITVNSCSFNSATQLTASISISASAALGSRNVTVTNPDSQSSTLSNGFTVTTTAPPPPPTLSSVNPSSGAQGQSLASVILTGSNFQSGATCNFGADITVNSCSFNSATQLTASISISASAALGSRNITVTNPDNQSSTLSNGFSVAVFNGISVIQTGTFSLQPSSDGNVTLTLPQATGAGHTLIVGVSFRPLDIASVTDDSGDKFNRGLGTSIFHNVSGSATYTNFYYAPSTVGGSTSLTLSFSGGSTYVVVAVAEVAGLNPSNPLDQSGFNDSLMPSSVWSSGNVTTTSANEYLFSWAATTASNDSCSNPAAGWSIESQTNDPNGAAVCLLDRIVSSRGSYQASVTPSSPQDYVMEVVSFRRAKRSQ